MPTVPSKCLHDWWVSLARYKLDRFRMGTVGGQGAGDTEGHLCACWWDYGWLRGQSPPLLGNNSATQRWRGQTSRRSPGWALPEGCPGNHGCRSPQPFASLPWRRRDGGSEGSRTGGLHQELRGNSSPHAYYWGRGWPGDQFSNYTTVFKCQFLLSCSWVSLSLCFVSLSPSSLLFLAYISC